MHNAIRAFVLLLAHPGLVAAVGGGGHALAQMALDKMIRDGRDVFGDLDEPAAVSASFPQVYSHGYARHAHWMAAVPDTVPITRLNIPGTHDAATWNYSQATQDGLSEATRCNGVTAAPARVYRCQRRSIAEALEGGIRFFDLRFALDPLDARLVFWHGPALLSAAAGVEDVLFGFYAWLDGHPTETLLLSFQYERGTRANATSDARVQGRLLDALTSDAARRYVHQARGAPRTLGEARGKIILLRRFDLDALPPDAGAALPGLDLSPTKWPDNSKGFELPYGDDATDGGVARAFIEDYYHPGDEYATVGENVDAKFEAVEAHLTKAIAGDFESLFVTFTSGTHVEADPPVYPEVMALGSGDVRGINHRLLRLLRGMKGRRLGVVVMDFFEEPDGLVDLLLDF